MTKEKTCMTTGKKPKEEEPQMFWKPCFKIKWKGLVCFFSNEMVFKLTGNEHEEAIALKGAQRFDPSEKSDR